MTAFILRRLAQALVVMGVVALVLDLGVNRSDQESL
jgi:hypothetical protein